MSENQRKVDAISKKYDEQRKKFIPCFDDFYGVAVSVASVDAENTGILDIGAGTGLLSAFLMEIYPEAVRDGAYASSLVFSVVIPLIVMAFLLASFVPNRHDLKRIKTLLVVAEVVFIILSLMISKQAGYYLESFGFYDMAIPEFICARAYLFAGILLIIASVELKRSTSSE